MASSRLRNRLRNRTIPRQHTIRNMASTLRQPNNHRLHNMGLGLTNQLLEIHGNHMDNRRNRRHLLSLQRKRENKTPPRTLKKHPKKLHGNRRRTNTRSIRQNNSDHGLHERPTKNRKHHNKTHPPPKTTIPNSRKRIFTRFLCVEWHSAIPVYKNTTPKNTSFNVNNHVSYKPTNNTPTKKAPDHKT